MQLTALIATHSPNCNSQPQLLAHQESWTFIARDREQRDVWNNALVQAIKEATHTATSDGDDDGVVPGNVLGTSAENVRGGVLFCCYVFLWAFAAVLCAATFCANGHPGWPRSFSQSVWCCSVLCRVLIFRRSTCFLSTTAGNTADRTVRDVQAASEYRSMRVKETKEF